MEPRAQGKWMAEMERRLRTLEQSPRVPALSLPDSSRGIQMATSNGGTLTNTQSSDFAGSGQRVRVVARTGPTGSILLIYGAELQVGGAHQANAVVMEPYVSPGYSGLGFSVLPRSISAVGGSVLLRTVVTATKIVIDPNVNQTITAQFTQSIHFSDAGVGTVGVPWLIAIPL